jgi:hypothetical protein
MRNSTPIDLSARAFTLPRVRYKGLAIVPFLCLLSSCSSFHSITDPHGDQPAAFAPVAMRIHPIFTRIEDFNGDNYPDGIDALIEFQDQFGDATKATGRAIFEVYSYQKFDAERKGDRLVNPWIGDLETVDDQRLRWNRTSRTYSFPLEFDQVNPGATYVLTCEFQQTNGKRFFDQIILEPPEGAYAVKQPGVPTSQPVLILPSSEPSTQPTSQP